MKNTEVNASNSISLHREMYERRCHRINWTGGRDIKQLVKDAHKVRVRITIPESKDKARPQTVNTD